MIHLSRLTCVVLLWICGLAVAPAAAQWDVSADFDMTSNPGALVAGGQWSYGYLPYEGGVPNAGAFTLYDEAGKVVDPNAPFAWQDLAAGSVDTLGAVSFNESANFKTFFGIDWEPLEVNLVPDQTKSAATAVKLTVPTAGQYQVQAAFADNQNCCAGRESDAWVLSGSGGVLFTQPILPSSDALITHAAGTQRDFVTYDGLVQLTAGDSLYFASGALGTGGDHAVLRATVRLVPEPASALLLLLGSTGAWGACRRTRGRGR